MEKNGYGRVGDPYVHEEQCAAWSNEEAPNSGKLVMRRLTEDALDFVKDPCGIGISSRHTSTQKDSKKTDKTTHPIHSKKTPIAIAP